MGVPIIENWTEVEGLVRSLAPSPDIQNHMVAEIEVHRSHNVEGFANLLNPADGKLLRVHVSNEVAERTALAPGAKIHCRIRLGGSQRIFVHPTEIRVG